MANILSIDDSPLVLHMIKTNLEKAGHTVFTAEDWPEARQYLKADSPIELVIVDVVLPGFQSGAEMARSLKIHPKLKDAKIIFYSSKSSKFLERQAKLLRLHGYIHKDSVGADFVAQVHEIIVPPDEVSEETMKNIPLPPPPPVKPGLRLSPEMIKRLRNRKK